MQTFIALLRGINVGGQKKIPMAELRSILSKTSLQNVSTYIQTGNIFFQSIETNKSVLEYLIQTEIKQHFGFEVDVLIVINDDIQRILNDCPFPNDIKEKSYFMMLHDTPSEELIKIASEKIYEDEAYKIINDCIYYYCPKGIGQAKFNMNYFERKLNTFATARNYNTMLKLLYLSAELEN
uniref:DUF1697 domain-containing protein n=1 Tax=Gelidibacter sp. TaxID=2018083 RepID=UPI00404B78F1